MSISVDILKLTPGADMTAPPFFRAREIFLTSLFQFVIRMDIEPWLADREFDSERAVGNA